MAADKETFEYFKDDHFARTEEIYFTTLDYMAKSLEAAESIVHRHTASTIHSRSNPGFSATNLPSINLSLFDGKYEEWEPFRDRFTTLIIQNNELIDFSRMHYLMLALSSALESVRGLSVTDENFSIAWRTLTARFENKRRILKRHLTALFNLPAVIRKSAQELQLFLDRVNMFVAALQKLNRSPDELWSDTLVYFVVQKLDPITCRVLRPRARRRGRARRSVVVLALLAVAVLATKGTLQSRRARYS